MCCALSPVLPYSYSSNRYSSNTCCPFCLWNGVMVTSPTIPVISNERAHTHEDPLTALVIGVSSSVDISVGEQETTEAAPKETIARLFPSEGMCCAVSITSSNHRTTCLHTPISGIRHYNRYFTTHSHTIPSGWSLIFRITHRRTRYIHP